MINEKQKGKKINFQSLIGSIELVFLIHNPLTPSLCNGRNISFANDAVNDPTRQQVT